LGDGIRLALERVAAQARDDADGQAAAARGRRGGRGRVLAEPDAASAVPRPTAPVAARTAA
jgi:hypothetical protein